MPSGASNCGPPLTTMPPAAESAGMTTSPLWTSARPVSLTVPPLAKPTMPPRALAMPPIALAPVEISPMPVSFEIGPASPHRLLKMPGPLEDWSPAPGDPLAGEVWPSLSVSALTAVVLSVTEPVLISVFDASAWVLTCWVVSALDSELSAVASVARAALLASSGAASAAAPPPSPVVGAGAGAAGAVAAAEGGSAVETGSPPPDVAAGALRVLPAICSMLTGAGPDGEPGGPAMPAVPVGEIPGPPPLGATLGPCGVAVWSATMVTGTG